MCYVLLSQCSTMIIVNKKRWLTTQALRLTEPEVYS